MMGALFLVAVTALAAADEMLVHRGPGFTLTYPKKHSKLQPPSAAVPFQLVYRKNSLLRLETERLTRPIDLNDESFAAIFQEVQLERLRERVDAPVDMARVRRFSWGPAVELRYYLPARSGKKGRRDLVTEIVTTVGETLYRFTYWIPERDLKKVAGPFAQVIESFAPEGLRASSDTEPAKPLPPSRYSRAGAEAELRDSRKRLDAAPEPSARAEVYAHLAEVLGWKAYLDDGAEAKELQEMRQAAEAALLTAPDDVDAHQARAWAAYHDNRMVEMEKEIQAALRIEPDNAETHLLYALWYGFNPERSEEMARRALEANPDYAAAYYVKAVADRKQGELREAREALERAVELDPGFTEARVELAEVLRESGDLQAAIDAYRAAARAAPPADPNVLNVRFQLAVLLRQQGRIDDAITEYQNLLRIDDSVAEAHFNLAVLLLQEKKKPALAREHFRRFVELDPESPKAAKVRQWLARNPGG